MADQSTAKEDPHEASSPTDSSTEVPVDLSQLNEIEAKGYTQLQVFLDPLAELNGLALAATQAWASKSSCPLCTGFKPSKAKEAGVKPSKRHVLNHFRKPNANEQAQNLLVPNPENPSEGWFVTFCNKEYGVCFEKGKHRQHYHCPRCQRVVKQHCDMTSHVKQNCPALQQHLEPPGPCSADRLRPAGIPAGDSQWHVMKIDEAHGVYAVCNPRSRFYAQHVISKQSSTPCQGSAFCSCNDAALVEGVNQKTKKNYRCIHLQAVDASLAGYRSFLPDGKLMPDPEANSVGLGAPELMNTFNQLLTCSMLSPLIVDLTAEESQEHLCFRRFSVLKDCDSYERVAVHIPTKNAKDCPENGVSCSHCTLRTCLHIQVVEESLRLESLLDSFQMSNRDIDDAPATMDQRTQGPLFSLEKTAEVLRLQCQDFTKTLQKSGGQFWSEVEITEESLPSQRLCYPGRTCRRCGWNLEMFDVEHTIVVTRKSVFTRFSEAKVCGSKVCRALHSWFGWSSQAHNSGNKVILSFALLDDIQGHLRDAQVSITSSIRTKAEWFRDHQQHRSAKLLASNEDQIRHAVLEFLTLYWLPKAQSYLCVQCGDAPHALIFDGVQSVLFVETQKGELADDPDGSIEYSRETAAAIWRTKENAVIVRNFAGRSSLEVPESGHGFSNPWSPILGPKVCDSERKKGTPLDGSSYCDREAVLVSESNGLHGAPHTSSSSSGISEASSAQPSASSRDIEEFLSLCQQGGPFTKEVWKYYLRAFHLSAPSDRNAVMAGCIRDFLEDQGFKVAGLLKKFTKKKSGGLLLGICPHGFIYYFKFLRKPESPRDHVDAMMSLLFIPYVYVGDLAVRVGSHYAHLFQEAAMSFLRGAVHEATLENAEKFDMKQLPEKFLKVEIENHVKSGQKRDLLFTLLDIFHQRNHKDVTAKLYRLANFKDHQRRGQRLNSQACEQRNAIIKKQAGSLSQWLPHSSNVLLAVLATMWNRESLMKQKERIRRGIFGAAASDDLDILAESDEESERAGEEEDIEMVVDDPCESFPNGLDPVQPSPPEPTPGPSWQQYDEARLPSSDDPNTAYFIDVPVIPLSHTTLATLRQKYPRRDIKQFPAGIYPTPDTNFAWVKEEFNFVKELNPAVGQNMHKTASKSCWPTFVGGLPEKGEVMVDKRRRNVEVAIIHPTTNQLCHGCFGRLGEPVDGCSSTNKTKRRRLGAIPQAPFDLALAVPSGYRRSTRGPGGFQKFEENVWKYFHFRPMCFRVLFPNTKVTEFHLVDGVEISETHEAVIGHLVDLQVRFPDSTPLPDWMIS